MVCRIQDSLMSTIQCTNDRQWHAFEGDVGVKFVLETKCEKIIRLMEKYTSHLIESHYISDLYFILYTILQSL